FDSALNAGRKGQRQFFTPPNFGRAIAGALDPCRPVITDLMCGAGHLFRACLNENTRHLLGCEIDPAALADNSKFELVGSAAKIKAHLVRANLLDLYPLLHEVDWQGTLFALNPPFSLEFPLDQLRSEEHTSELES